MHKYNHLKRDPGECWHRVNMYNNEAFDFCQAIALKASSEDFQVTPTAQLLNISFSPCNTECKSVIVKTLKELKRLLTEQKKKIKKKIRGLSLLSFYKNFVKKCDVDL